MKRTIKTVGGQFNLSLISAPPTAVPQDKINELKRALVELLTSAARSENANQVSSSGGEDES